MSGTVSVTAGHAAGGPYNLAVAAFEITNTNTTGAKLGAGSSSPYAVTVLPPAGSTAPVIVPTVSGTKGLDNWYTSDVMVSWSVSDGQSAFVIDSGCTPVTFTADTTGVSSSCTASSAGGTDTKSVTVKIDKTAPTGVVLAPSGTEGTNGWYTSNVLVSTSGVDGTSGVSCTADQPFTSETAGQTVNGSCTNGAGLKTDAPPLQIKIDKTGPSAALSPAGTKGANDWYTTNVTVAATGADSISGPVICSDPVNLINETDGTVVEGSCTNAAGLTTDATPLTVKIDKSNPTAALAPMGTAGANGWYTSNVTVKTEGADNMSTPVICTADQLFTSETTGQAVDGSCTNGAGLTQAAAPMTIKIDKTPPSVVLNVVEGTSGTNGCYTSNVKVRASGEDSTSGIEKCSLDTLVDNETAGTLVTGWCENGAGEIAYATPLTIKVDKSAPSATLQVTSETLGSTGGTPATSRCRRSAATRI